MESQLERQGDVMWTSSSSTTSSSRQESTIDFVLALQLTLLAVISLAGTFANALVFAVFYRRSSLRTISNRFVLSLVLANLVSSVLVVPGHICDMLDQEMWSLWNQSVDGVTVLISLSSVLSILLISLDRYYAVNSPLHYSIIVTRQKSIAMIAFVWLISIILSSPVWTGCVVLKDHPAAPELNSTATGALGDDKSVASDEQLVINLCYTISLFFFGLLSPLAALCWLYYRMYRAALKNSARTRRQSLCSNLAAETMNPDHHDGSSVADRQHCSLAGALTAAATAAAVAQAAVESKRQLKMAADAAASNAHRRRGNRCLLRLGGVQRQLLMLLWREEGRALRTTAMVISSFLCCWLPLFVSLLVADRTFLFFPARLAAFTNVLVSPAIYVYRNQVAQREAGRVLLMLFCPCRRRTAAATLPSYTLPCMPVGLGHHSDRLRVLSRPSSLMSSAENTPKKVCEGRETVLAADSQREVAAFKPVVVNWVGDIPICSQLLDRSEPAAKACTPSSIAQGALSLGLSGDTQRRTTTTTTTNGRTCPRSGLHRNRSNASIAGDMTFPVDNIAIRQRSLTVSGDVYTAASKLEPIIKTRPVTTSNTPNLPEEADHEQQSSGVMCAEGTKPWCHCHATRYDHEFKLLNHQTYPSLDFFDIGLEDFGRRATSFSRYVHDGTPPSSTGAVQAAVVASHSTVQVGANRKWRTSSFSKVLLSRSKKSTTDCKSQAKSTSSVSSVQETKSSYATAV